jgi:hypothetical protein
MKFLQWRWEKKMPNNFALFRHMHDQALGQLANNDDKQISRTFNIRSN